MSLRMLIIDWSVEKMEKDLLPGFPDELFDIESAKLFSRQEIFDETLRLQSEGVVEVDKINKFVLRITGVTDKGVSMHKEYWSNKAYWVDPRL